MTTKKVRSVVGVVVVAAVVIIIVAVVLVLVVVGASHMRVGELGELAGGSQCRAIAQNELDLTSICFRIS